MAKEEKRHKCYVCGTDKKTGKGFWYYKPQIRTKKHPDIRLCPVCTGAYLKAHLSWKNVKRTLTGMKKSKAE